MKCENCEFFYWCPRIDGWTVLMPRDYTKTDKEHCYHYLRGLEQIIYFDDGVYQNPCPLLKGEKNENNTPNSGTADKS